MSTRFVRFVQKASDTPRFGQLDDENITVLNRAPWAGIETSGETLGLADVRLLAPVDPSKIICIGLNYHAHVKASYSADEAPENPLLFMKPPSSIIAAGDKIVHPGVCERMDYEAELGLVIGATAKDVPAADAEQYIFGFTCVNDVTARDLQKKDGQWTRAKGFDTFCPVGPWIVDRLDWQDILVEGVHNGEIRQSGRTSQMIFPIPRLIEYISSVMTLNPGDLISTGTPSGIAPMKSGDSIIVRVQGIGSLENTVA